MEEILNHFLIDINLDWKHKREVVFYLCMCIFITVQMSQKNPNCGGSYIDSPEWVKNKESNNKSHQQK